MKTINTYSILGLVLMHTIGISLFIIDPKAAALSYIIIAASALLVYLGQGAKTLIPLVIIAFGGFIFEWIGVHTGALFGEYSYQSALVAIKYGFWYWSSGEIPLYNYICWFIFSFIFALVALRYLKRPNKTGTALFITWTVFFTLLNFI